MRIFLLFLDKRTEEHIELKVKSEKVKAEAIIIKKRKSHPSRSSLFILHSSLFFILLFLITWLNHR